MDEKPTATTGNPLMEPYATRHDTVPFSRIRTEHIEEAIKEGIRRDNELIERIVENKKRPTFENTIAVRDDGAAGDYYGLLDRATTILYNLLSAETNDELDQLAERVQPMLTQHANDVRLNARLFDRVKAVHQFHRLLTREEKRLLDDCYNGFVRSGALLDDEGKERLRQLTDEASRLQLKFQQNLLQETKAYRLHIDDAARLAGLPPTAIEAAAEAAREDGHEGWTFTLDQPSYGPLMAHADDRELRRELYMAKNTLCCHGGETDNRDICRRIVDLRREMAQLLGYENYAEYVLKERMAGSTRGVYHLLDQLLEAYKPAANREMKHLRALATRDFGPQTTVEPWDVAYLSRRLKLQKHNIDAEMVRPYMELGRVVEGVFALANRLYGITFSECEDIEVYHEDVKAYEVRDADGSYLAVFYADFFPRKGKRGGAWMTLYQGQWTERGGRNVRPHVSVVMNLTKPTAEKPALLTLGEVETLLHEFGHALHAMFSNTRFEALSCTNVWWDFVELPSQLMENYAVEKDFLRTFAVDYKTGEPMPDELIDRIVESRNFMVAYGGLRQVSYALLDMAYYTLDKPMEDDVTEFEKRAWAKATILPTPEETCMTVQFGHIMSGGYAAGYYSYKWAEVLEADAFAVFKRNGIFNPKTAKRFRDCILSRGGTAHPMELYKKFRRGEPTITALLRRSGIKRRTLNGGS